MAVRTLDSIIAETSKYSDPQRQLVLGQIANIPQEQQAQEAGLQAKLGAANEQILGGARQRGLGFAGLPIAEQAKYAATDFAPAMAKLQSDTNSRKASLQDVLYNIGKQDYQTANSIYGQEQSLAEQQRQFDLSYALQKQQADASARAAAQQSSLASMFAGSTTPKNTATSAVPTITQRNDKGFNFSDAAGNAVSAARYAQLKGIPFRTLLTDMAKAGDTGAKQALGFVGNDYGYDPGKIGNLGALYDALVWGTGKKFSGGTSVAKNVGGVQFAGSTNPGVPSGNAILRTY